MKPLFDMSEPEAAPCSDAMEEALNFYIDGELPFGEQPLLFAHLSTCVHCRSILGTMLEFRRMSRQEAFPVPPAIDDAIFERLNQVKKRANRIDRYWDRRPLWQTRASVSWRAAALVAVMLFSAGLMFPQDVGEPQAVIAPVFVHEDHVVDNTPIPVQQSVMYVFYPGLTVESTRIVEPVVSDSY